MGGKSVLTNESLLVVGREKVPTPKYLDAASLATQPGQWVGVAGKVRVAEAGSGRLKLTLQGNDQDCVVFVMGQPKGQDFRWLLDRLVHIRGVNGSKAERGKLVEGILFSPSVDDIQLLDQSKADPLNIPVIAISTVLGQELGSWTNNRVHLSGSASSYLPGKSLVISDPTGSIVARSTQSDPLQTGDRVDVWGFLRSSRSGPVLDYSYFEKPKTVSPSLVSANKPEQVKKPTSQLALTNIADIVRLSREDATKGLPILVRGIITFADPEWGTAFIQDSGGGMYFNLKKSDVHSGQWVELSGETSPGGFLTEAVKTSVRVLGTTNFPPAEHVDLTELANGTLDSHWVQLEGVVRGVEQKWGHAYLTVATRNGRFKALIPGLDDANPPSHLVDARVMIEGACSSQLNAQQQLVGITLQVPGLDHVKILRAAPPKPFAIETTPIALAAMFSPNRVAGHRIKVEGVVTLSLPGDGFVLQDASGGLRVHTSLTNEVQVGASVEVLGFLGMAGFSPNLDEGLVRVIGKGAVVPKATTAEAVISLGTNDQTLATISGRLLQRVSQSASPEMILQDGPVIFSARIQTSKSDAEYLTYQPGTVLRMTGVCSIQAGEQHEATGFRILVHRPEDIIVLQKPAWWTDSRVIWVAGGLFAAVLMVLAWSLVLSHKNRQLRWVRDELRNSNEDLEARVERRTTALKHEVEVRQRSEEVLAEERRLLRTLIDNLPLSIYIKDTSGRFVVSNLTHQRLRGGGSEASIVGKTVFDFCPAEVAALYDADDQEVLRCGREINAKEEPSGTDGPSKWHATSKIPIRDLAGKIVGLVGISQDITERKQAQADLERIHKSLMDASRMAGMAEIATGVLHNIGNILNSVNISTSVVGDQIRKSEISSVTQISDLLMRNQDNLKGFLTDHPKGRLIPEFIHNLSRRLQSEQADTLKEMESLGKNIDHIKAIVAMQQGYTSGGCVIEVHQARSLVEEAMEVTRAKMKQEDVLIESVFEDTPPVLADRYKCQQILVNLLTNAQQAMDKLPEGERKIEVGIRRNGNDLAYISVRDRGIGISEEHLVRVFSHGFTTKKDGHGFGLHSAAIAAKQMGGSLECHSDGFGKGSTFTLILPILKP